MRTTQQLSITLPIDMARYLEKKVKSGEYASVSEAVRDSLRAQAQKDKAYDAALEKWLQTEVAESVKAYESDPSSAKPMEEVFEELEAHHRERLSREGKVQ